MKGFIKVLLIVILSMILLKTLISIVYTGGSANNIDSDSIGVISFNSQIFESEQFIKDLDTLVKNDKIKGIIIKVNSPGGAITASVEIYEYILSIDKPVYIAMGSVAASGGYMIALAGEKIYAMPTTVTGSIGVIMTMVNTEGLFNKIGIKSVILKSGKFKDTGNPDRPMTKEDRAILMAVVDDMYNQFVDIIVERRKMSVKDVKKIADGRILTGNMAYKLNLIDQLGSYEDAFNDMKIALDIPTLDMYEFKKKKNFFDKLMEGTEAVHRTFSQEIGIYYLMN